MSDKDEKDYFDRMVDAALISWTEIDERQLRRQVMMILKSVERDTRHNCVGLVYDLANKMHNSRPE